jgi:hypothetical protein
VDRGNGAGVSLLEGEGGRECCRWLLFPQLVALAGGVPCEKLHKVSFPAGNLRDADSALHQVSSQDAVANIVSAAEWDSCTSHTSHQLERC